MTYTNTRAKLTYAVDPGGAGYGAETQLVSDSTEAGVFNAQDGGEQLLCSSSDIADSTVRCQRWPNLNARVSYRIDEIVNAGASINTGPTLTVSVTRASPTAEVTVPHSIPLAGHPLPPTLYDYKLYYLGAEFTPMT